MHVGGVDDDDSSTDHRLSGINRERQRSLKAKLAQRPPMDEVVQRNIMVVETELDRAQRRQAAASSLERWAMTTAFLARTSRGIAAS